MQPVLAQGKHYDHVEALRQDALFYWSRYGANYFTDITHLHDQLGLMIRRNGVTIMSELVPKKEKETTIYAQEFNPEELGQVVSRLINGYMNKLGVRSFDFSLATPPLESDNEDWSRFPGVVAHLIDRGDPTNRTNDIGSMELWGTPIVATDPYKVHAALKSVI